MTYVRLVGDDQKVTFIQHPPDAEAALILAKEALDNDRFNDAYSLLKPQIDAGNAEAQYLGASFSLDDETEDEYDTRHLNLIRKSASKDYPPALYTLGCYYDTGELVPTDKLEAAQLFKRGAVGGHPHCQWIYGLDLLYGNHGISKDVKLGMDFLQKAAKAKFEGAIENLADFYEKGEFGLPVDAKRAQELRRQLDEDDLIGY